MHWALKSEVALDFEKTLRHNLEQAKTNFDKRQQEFQDAYSQPKKYTLKELHKRCVRLRSSVYDMISVCDTYEDEFSRRAWDTKQEG